MISRLTLTNFQGHSHTVVDFSKGFNCLVGSTNSGKSSILRALKFALCGEPWDKHFVRDGAEYAEIILEMSNGDKITRRKGEDINEYELNGVEYKNFGVKIPSDIRRAININPIELEDQDINLNFSDQLDALFLIDDTDTLKARLLNKFSGMDVIDDVLVGLSEDKRESTSITKALDKLIEEQQLKLKSYDDIESKKSTLYSLDLEMEEFSTSSSRLELLSALRSDLDVWKQNRIRLKQAQNQLVPLTLIDLDGILKSLEGVETTLNDVRRINKLENEISLARKDLQNISKVNVDESFDAVFAVSEQIKLKKDVANYLHEVLDKERLSYKLRAVEEEYADNKRKFDELCKGTNCPLCGADLTGIKEEK